MRVLLTFTYDGDNGPVTDTMITTVRDFKQDNLYQPAAWVIEQDIRQHGSYTYTTAGGVTVLLTRVPRKSKNISG